MRVAWMTWGCLAWIVLVVGSPADAAEDRPPDMPPADRAFRCDDAGYVRHWAVCGPRQTPYAGRGGNSRKMHDEALDRAVISPPAAAVLGTPGPAGEAWRFYAPGENIFVECTAFYHKLTVLDYYAETEIQSPRATVLPARLWAVGRADLWVGGAHVARLDVARGHRVESTPVQLPLQPGVNRLCVRLQALGERDTRMLFGLQVLEGAAELRVRLPGPAGTTQTLVAAESWMRSVKPDGRDALLSAAPAPKNVSVRYGSPAKTQVWTAGIAKLPLDRAQAFQVTVSLAAAGQKLQRLLEIPANEPAAPPTVASVPAHRRQYLEHLAALDRPAHDVLQVLTRRTLGPATPADTPVIAAALKGIESRRDCSDFTLAVLLRLVALGQVTADEAAEIQRVALGFRYWHDEPGTDAMCFESENHALLFHGAQLLAGRLYPEATFANTHRKGTAQAAIALARCREWVAKREQEGFVEFYSSTYIPLTMGALMNVIDFSGDAELARRAAALADRVFRDLATQAFDGVTVAPQGRVYRNVLYPQDSGTQALLAYATPAAALSYHSWVAVLASSPHYRVPGGLEVALRQPVSRRTRESEAEIVTCKTPAWLLTSVAIPRSQASPGAQPSPGKPGGLQPGNPGYQQHLWHATLGRDCHVFVNHPGASFDQSESRPGFWYGNGVLPRLAQRQGLLLEIFDIPDTYPIGFTHAHWPADVFAHQEIGTHWAFGAKGDGRIALWCSQPLQPHDDVLTGRELRATARRAAWLCVCGDLHATGGWDAFRQSCLTLEPSFDVQTKVLTVRGQDPLRWSEASR